MALRNLHVKARPFRYWGYAWLAVMIALAGWQTTLWRWLPLVVLVCGWPFAADAFHRGRFASVRWVVVVHVAEAGVLGALLAFVPLSRVSTCLVAIVVLASTAAQAGVRLAVTSALAFGLGWLLVYRIVGIHPPVASADVDLVGLLLTGSFAISLSYVGFRQAQRLQRAREQIAEKNALLQSVSQRFARYLPGTVSRGVWRAPGEPMPLERRWLTVAFVDLAGFTEFAAQQAPEPVALVLNDYFHAMDLLVERWGGTLAKVLGDGVLLYFEPCDPGTQDVSAQNAGKATPGNARETSALACIEVSRRAAPVLDDLRARWRAAGVLPELATRVGVASGYCTIGDWGVERLDHTVIGSAVNLAARLQVAAPESGVLACPVTAALLRDCCRFRVVQKDVKGFGGLRLHELVDRPEVC